MTLAQLHTENVAKLQLLVPLREAQASSYALLAHFTKLSRTQVYASPNTELTPDAVQKINTAITELLAAKPLQYVIGETIFYDCPIEVNESVLIPRPETEELIDWVVKANRKLAFGEPVIIDLCTGSGCIAIALAKQFPQATLYACDSSDKALAVARRNAERNNVHIHFFRCDVLSSETIFPFTKVDCIVSNPPYVRKSEAALMADNVLRYEPHQALFVDDSDPLIFYRAIAAIAQQRLQKGGNVFAEINEAMGDATKAVFTAAGFALPEVRKDLRGKDRMIRATITL